MSPRPNQQTCALRMTGISKSFANMLAVRDVDFEARPGEVHVLLDENGAGKSTLMKIFAGALWWPPSWMEIRKG